MPNNKNQHYVPRLLLRKFAVGESEAVKLYIVATGKFVPGASISGQCKGSYFYGEGGPYDSGLQEIENNFAKVLPELKCLTDPPPPDSSHRAAMDMFILSQTARTKAAADELNSFLDQHRKYALDPMLIRKGIATQTQLDSVKMHLTEPAQFSLRIAMSSLPLIIDLDVRLLTAGEGALFLSDNPAILLNQARHRNSSTSSVGYALSGLQIILPVSPNSALFYFDRRVYKVGTRAERFVVHITKHDVEVLNRVQFANAQSTIYLPPSVTEGDVRQFAQRNRNSRSTSDRVRVEENKLPKQNGRGRSIVYGYKKDLPVLLDWSFCHVKTRERTVHDAPLSVRDPELCKIHKEVYSKDPLDKSDAINILAYAIQKAKRYR